MAELGGKQLSTLLESLPGIASVLRSPVADAIANLIRAAAGEGEFHENDVRELLQYATRRGLMGNDEADYLVEEVQGRWKKAAKRGRPKPAKRPEPTPEVRIPVEQVKGAVSSGTGKTAKPSSKGAREASAGKAATKKAVAKQGAPKKAAPKKAAPKKAAPKKAAAKKAAPKKARAKKAVAKKAPTRKASAKKAGAGKSARKTAAKSKARKTTARKSTKSAKKTRRK